jgi:hypothetical protein
MGAVLVTKKKEMRPRKMKEDCMVWRDDSDECSKEEEKWLG